MAIYLEKRVPHENKELFQAFRHIAISVLKINYRENNNKTIDQTD